MPPSRGWVDAAAVAENGNHVSQYLIFPERTVEVIKRVTASDETISVFSGQAVRNKLLIAKAQHNLPWK